RHGDHEDEQDLGLEVVPPEAMDHMQEASLPHEQVDHGHTHDHHDEASSEHAESDPSSHSHGSHPDTSHGGDHGYMHMSNPADSVPSADVAGTQLIPIPEIRVAHGHSHGGSGAVQEFLNETSIFRAKGPDPLSYVEWDFEYGMGDFEQLKRFLGNEGVQKGEDIMGVVGGRWRKLFSEPPEERKVLADDIRSRIQNGEPARHGSLLMMHVASSIISCFILLPLALCLRAAHSSLAPLASLVYLLSLGGSMFLSMIYKALTPRLYPSNSHGGMGWTILWISLATLGADVFRLVAQIWKKASSIRAGRTFGEAGGQKWTDVFHTLLGKDLPVSSEKYDALEEEAMLSDEGQADAKEIDIEIPRNGDRSHHRRSSSSSPRVHFADDRNGSVETLEEVNWVGSGSTAIGGVSSSASPIRGLEDLPSPSSTVCNTPRSSMLGDLSSMNLKTALSWKYPSQSTSGSDPSSSPTRLQKLATVWRFTRVVAARSLPVLAFAASYTGLAVYTGSCRPGYTNVCLAHGIKGGIFFWYGLFTFSRYVGAYADCGWAWNRRPSPGNARRNVSSWRKNMPSAEWVECFVIFLYGSTNTWMERFGSKRGDPYTIKQIQHISIAVMFWFAGLIGMLLETAWIRNLVSLPVALNHPSSLDISAIRSRRRGAHPTDAEEADELVQGQAQPPSYQGSFNPFPALVIGVTGVAMAAHHQDYVYEVKIHELWGQGLAGFAVLRCLTYFFLWLRPPTSVLPSRPPTEALASFSLACGGLIFMLSSEEVSFAAMRSGYGDFMAILNVAVAVVALLFCWIMGIMLIKAWAVKRE
ncbi:hypothetical protein IE53DRAFT_300693, partial [Violaceomyces palustris]